MIPVEVRLRSPRASERDLPLPHGRGRAVHARSSATWRCSPSSRGTSGRSAPRRCASTRRLALAGGRRGPGAATSSPSEQAAPQAAAALAGPLALLVGNDFEKVPIEKLDVSVDAAETLETATLVRAWVDHASPAAAGHDACPVRVQLRTHRGETRDRDPAGRHPGERARPAATPCSWRTPPRWTRSSSARRARASCPGTWASSCGRSTACARATASTPASPARAAAPSWAGSTCPRSPAPCSPC